MQSFPKDSPNQFADECAVARSMVEAFSQKVWFTHVTVIHGQLKSLSNLAPNSNITIVETDDPDIVKISNLDVSFQNHICQTIQLYAESVKNDWQGLMKNIPLVSIPKIIKDDLTNNTNGYSFAFDPANSDIMLDLRRKLEQHNGFKLPPSTDVIETFKSHVKNFTLKLSILIHLTVGIPPRATETCSILAFNCPLLGKHILLTCRKKKRIYSWRSNLYLTYIQENNAKAGQLPSDCPILTPISIQHSFQLHYVDEAFVRYA
jgi:hypothetical protein